MTKPNGIFIDLTNKEQVNWWNKIGSKLVRTVRYDEIVETATNKPVGVMMQLSGMFKDYVIKKNNSFLMNTISMCIEIKE